MRWRPYALALALAMVLPSPGQVPTITAVKKAVKPDTGAVILKSKGSVMVVADSAIATKQIIESGRELAKESGQSIFDFMSWGEIFSEAKAAIAWISGGGLTMFMAFWKWRTAKQEYADSIAQKMTVRAEEYQMKYALTADLLDSAQDEIRALKQTIQIRQEQDNPPPTNES